MGRRCAVASRMASVIFVLAFAPVTSRAQGILDSLRWSSDPPTLSDVARIMDRIQNDILDEGTVVVKHPDVWSQARMTMFRKEFENAMQGELLNFNGSSWNRVGSLTLFGSRKHLVS
jgi:hypothetical protein